MKKKKKRKKSFMQFIMFIIFHFQQQKHNYAVQIPESEDGASLNLSKRSLADTSVTSTADLSIFSGGDRRPASQQQQNYEIDNSLMTNEKLHSSDIDLHNVVGEDEENGESSPKYVYCCCFYFRLLLFFSLEFLFIEFHFLLHN